MKNRETEQGLEADEQDKLVSVIAELEAEILFTPGSQNRTTIDVEKLVILIRAAKDSPLAQSLYESLVPAQYELEDIGRAHVAKDMGRVIARYLEFHSDEGETE